MPFFIFPQWSGGPTALLIGDSSQGGCLSPSLRVVTLCDRNSSVRTETTLNKANLRQCHFKMVLVQILASSLGSMFRFVNQFREGKKNNKSDRCHFKALLCYEFTTMTWAEEDRGVLFLKAWSSEPSHCFGCFGEAEQRHGRVWLPANTWNVWQLCTQCGMSDLDCEWWTERVFFYTFNRQCPFKVSVMEDVDLFSQLGFRPCDDMQHISSDSNEILILHRSLSHKNIIRTNTQTNTLLIWVAGQDFEYSLWSKSDFLIK